MWCCLLRGYLPFNVVVGCGWSVVGCKVTIGNMGSASCVRIEEGEGCDTAYLHVVHSSFDVIMCHHLSTVGCHLAPVPC